LRWVFINRNGTTLLYEDKFIRIDEITGIEIFWFYFPLTISKIVPWNEILQVNRPVDLHWADYKAWGMRFSNIWWACNIRRYCDPSDHNIILTTDSWVQKGFSVERPDQVMEIIRTHMSPNTQIIIHERHEQQQQQQQQTNNINTPTPNEYIRSKIIQIKKTSK